MAKKNKNKNEQTITDFFETLNQEINEIKQNIQYLLEILSCYAEAFIKLKNVIEKLHNINIE